MEWPKYLAFGVQEPVYHMCDEATFNSMTANKGLYYPPTYSQDGFIHATGDPNFLLGVGNHFYKSVVGNWICLKLEPSQLGGKIVYEAAAPVGNISAIEHENAPKFPHIYGGIPAKSVIGKYRIVRGADGSFLSIEGLKGGK
jgi:uncharacterized protein (DUF952 family)